MKPIVYLEDIADKLEQTIDGWEQYLNKANGEFVSLSDGTNYEVDRELADEIEFNDDYVMLPNQGRTYLTRM